MRQLTLVLLAAACGKSSSDAPAKPAAAGSAAAVDHAPDIANLETHQHLEAVAPTGRAFVTRAGDNLVVWARDGKQVATIPALATGKDADYERVAIDGGATLLAEAKDATIRVTDVASGRPLWTHELDDTIWGELAFSPNASLLAILAQGGVSLVDAKTADDKGSISSENPGPHFDGEPLTLTRQVWFAPDGLRIAIRCGRDTESLANHNLYVADAGSKRLTYAVPGQAGPIFGVQWLPERRIVTLDGRGTLRVIRDGVVERSLALGVQDPGAFAVSEDLSSVAVAGDELVVWRQGSGVQSAAKLDPREPAVYVELHPDHVVTLSTDGKLRSHPTPAGTSTGPTAWTAHTADDQARTAAIWQVARGEEVDPSAFVDPAVRAYAAWRAKPSRAYSGPVSLDLLAMYVDGGFIEDATALYAAWLAKPVATENARVKQLGLELDRLLQDDDEQAFLKAMYKHWPDDVDVVVRYANDTESSKQTDAILRRALARNKHAVRLWHELVWNADEPARPAIIDEAMRALTPDEQAALRAEL
jgi:hypothetical protein